MKRLVHFSLAALVVLVITGGALRGASAAKKHLGIATYSVKGLESDIEGSFKSLAADGYVVMEISNYDAAKGLVAGYKPADYAALAKKYGLTIISSHARGKFDTKDVEGSLAEWRKVFADHKLMGCKYVILPMNFWSSTVEALKAECDLMNKIGEEANKVGIKFGYHNHNFEFAKVKDTDQTFEEFLIANTDPSKVFFQMDVYWVTIGGDNPVSLLQKYPDRFKVLHIKDDYVIGESGSIDFKAIFTQFYKNGHKDWFVEMEDKVTPEQKKQMMGMMEMLKKRMSEGTGGNPFGPPPAQQGQQGQQGQQAQQGPPPGMGQQDPKAVAEKLKTSLDGIKQSADFLMKAEYVK
ncbi:MAG: sugar phosphate isomerase/epimerase [Bacteroidales bacterium]